MIPKIPIRCGQIVNTTSHIKNHAENYVWGKECLISEMLEYNGCIRHCYNSTCPNKQKKIENKIIFDPRKDKILLNKVVFCPNKSIGM